MHNLIHILQADHILWVTIRHVDCGLGYRLSWKQLDDSGDTHEYEMLGDNLPEMLSEIRQDVDDRS